MGNFLWHYCSMRWRWRGNICGDFPCLRSYSNTSVFHISPGLHPEKIPLGIRLSLTGTKNREKDQVTPYSALATALAATIGTGNIVGISTAIAIGGPGAVFWCWLTGGIRDSDLLCGMLSLHKIPGAQGRQYVCRRTDVYFGSASEKKKTGSGVCCMYAAGIVWYRKQRTVILHTHGAPASDYRVAASGRNGGRGACRDYYHRGNSQIAKVCMWLVPLMSAFYVGGCLYIIGRNRAVLPETLALIPLIRRLPEGCGGRLHWRSAASWHPDRSLPGIVYQ